VGRGDQITGIGGRYGFGRAAFCFSEGDLTQRALRSAKKRNAWRIIWDGVEVEVLRASPVEITGVQTPDLVGCAQDDKFFGFVRWW
jgi:hypothetical protein